MLQDPIVLGIDFGTTNSCISYYDNDNGNVRVIPNPEGWLTTPTCLYFDAESADILFGVAADNLFKSKNNSTFLKNIATNIKRLVGVLYKDYLRNESLVSFFVSKGNEIVCDIDGYCAIKFQHNNQTKILSIIDIIKYYLKYLVTCASECSGRSVEKVVITVPAYFTDVQRQLIKGACGGIGLEVLRILNEPTSAALAYAHSKQNNALQEKVLVIDCGGGTTDVSLLVMDYAEHIYEVKAVSGDNFLGGEDLTQELVNYVCRKLQMLTPTTKQLNTIKTQCELVKQQLSFTTNAAILLENIIEGEDKIVTISRQQFLDITATFFNKIKKMLRDVVCGHSDVVKVILVGGTTRTPKFIDLCKEVLGQHVEVCNNLDPDQTISMGAAVQGELLNNRESNVPDMLLLDVVPMSLGIETVGGIMSVLVSRNTSIPVSRTQIFTNTDDNTDTLNISVFQGERRLVKDCTLLATFQLNGLNNTMRKEEMKIRVSFDIDADGIVSVSAQDTDGNLAQTSIHVTKSNVQHETTDDLDMDIVLQDAYKTSQIYAKLELYNSFRELLTLFHDKHDTLGLGEDQFRVAKANELFNQVFQVIRNYEMYSAEQLMKEKEKFEEEWHTLMLCHGAFGGSSHIDLEDV